PPYWDASRHGAAWAQVASRVAAIVAEKRDPSRTWLGGLPDTNRHAAPLDEAPLRLDDQRLVEAGARYGVGARHQYGELYGEWTDTVEARLAAEWSEAATGVTFARVRDFVRIGWSLHA
ncbi:MAG: hypothetical protein MUC96_31620, partial [Myxococcaceae bacterium]|nr:hypothetical protein [Myxococcaceae bacterium]